MDATALIGVTGGAGTTRLCVETAATLARAGRDVAILDAAFDTQGLATYVSGRIDPDVTAVLAEGHAVEDALVDVWPTLDGSVAIAPAHAPFERLAHAKHPEVAQALERAVASLGERVDHVLLDVPPVGSNPAVAAVTAVDYRLLVAPDTRHGADLLPQMRGRVVDVGSTVDGIVVNRTESTDPAATALPEAAFAIPGGPETPREPACIDPDPTFAPAVATLAESFEGAALDLEFPSEGLIGRS